jgi:hypothetical protein
MAVGEEDIASGYAQVKRGEGRFGGLVSGGSGLRRLRGCGTGSERGG